MAKYQIRVQFIAEERAQVYWFQTQSDAQNALMEMDDAVKRHEAACIRPNDPHTAVGPIYLNMSNALHWKAQKSKDEGGWELFSIDTPSEESAATN